MSNFDIQTIILSFPIISPTHSRDRLYAVQVVLYGDLDVWDFLNLDALWISFIVRRDRARTSHTLSPCARMAISTDSGVSHNPHTRSNGQSSLSYSPFFRTTRCLTPLCVLSPPYRVRRHTCPCAGSMTRLPLFPSRSPTLRSFDFSPRPLHQADSLYSPCLRCHRSRLLQDYRLVFKLKIRSRRQAPLYPLISARCRDLHFLTSSSCLLSYNQSVYNRI